MKTKLLLASFMLAGLTYAQAQQPDTTTKKIWTLKECIEYALSNNLDVQRSNYNVETAEVTNRQNKMALLPTANAQVSNGYNWGRSINPVTNSFTTQRQSSLSPNASTSVTLFNGMRIQNTIKQGSKDLAASEQDLLKAKNDVSVNVTTLYINVVFNKELLENARFQLSSTQQQLERTKKQVEAGALPLSEQLNLDAQVATNELNVINSENTLNLSLLQLKQALQLPASEALDVEVPDLTVEDLVINQSRDQIYDIARQSMPEIKSAQLKVQSSYFAVRAARGSLYPRLTLNGSINSNYSSANDRPRLIQQTGVDVTPQTQVPVGYYVDPLSGSTVNVFGYNYNPTGVYSKGYGYTDQLKDNIFRSVSLALTIPIFNGLQSRSQLQRTIINQHLAEISAKQANNTLRQNVETAYNDAFAASKSYNSSIRQVNAREEAFRMVKQRREVGAANYVEYQVAENELFRAKSDLARAKYNFIFRKKLLDFYQGIPLGF